MQELVYKSLDINRTIDNIVEQNFDIDYRYVRCKDANDTSYEITSLSSSDNVYNFDPIHRINVYLNKVYSFLAGSKNEMLTNNISVSLNYDVNGFNTYPLLFSLTDYRSTSITTFNVLSSFVNRSLDDVLSNKNALKSTYSDSNMVIYENNNNLVQISFNSYLKKLTNNLLLFYDNVASLILQLEFMNTLADISDILYVLNIFINKLKKCKCLLLTISEKITNTNTKFVVKGSVTLDIIGISDQIKKLTGLLVSLNIFPIVKVQLQYTEQLFAVDINNNDNNNFKFPFIIYDSFIDNDSLKTIPDSISGSNGHFSVDTSIKKYNTFNITIDDIANNFNLKRGVLITRKKILQAIDYIFYYWLLNMSTINYNIVLCHNNCHTNIVLTLYEAEIIQYTEYFVKTTINLHYTGGCGCSIKTSESINISKLIPQNHRNSNTYFNISDINRPITMSVYVNAYYENILYSPTQITLAGVLYYNSNLQRTNNSYSIPADIYKDNKKITVSALYPSDIKPTDIQYFCIKLLVTIPYFIKNTTTNN